MEIDTGTVIGIAAMLAFIGGVAWFEVLSRRQRRRQSAGESSAAPTGVAAPKSPDRPVSRR